jgi:hypothetical protein
VLSVHARALRGLEAIMVGGLHTDAGGELLRGIHHQTLEGVVLRATNPRRSRAFVRGGLLG